MNYLKIQEAIFLAHINGCLYRADEYIEKFPIDEFPMNERINYYSKPLKIKLKRGSDRKGRLIFFNPFQEARFLVYRKAS